MDELYLEWLAQQYELEMQGRAVTDCTFENE